MSDLSKILASGKNVLPGYAVCIDSAESWIVAVNNAGPASDPEQVTFLGSHPDTDETFILVAGTACLAAAPYETPEEFTIVPLERGACCNVRRKTWHSVLMSPGSTVAICENRDPGSERHELGAAALARLREQAKTALSGE